jgi:phosphatidylinositol alpha-1,6-mannosyltransferase
LAERGRPVQVLLVGKGRTENQLRRRAERKGVDIRFEIDVPWERLPDLYREADIFCMPCQSRWGGLEIEGLGLVFLEAAASGLPVLAGDSGGAAETVEPARTGFVVHDAADIAEGIEMLVSDPERAAAMGAAGRRRMEAEFTWNAVVERLVSGFADAGARPSSST